MSTKTIDTEHPDYLFNDYTYIDNIINYTINITNEVNSFQSETITVEIYVDNDDYLTDINTVVIFNIDELRGRKYRITAITMHSNGYDNAITASVEAQRIY